jgi:hypothetical protein
MTIKLVTEKQQPILGYTSPHYQVAGQILYSKIDALQHCKPAGVEWPTFQVWNHTNGYSRPPGSFWQITVGAAEKLGRAHGAVRLWYSGGSDSHAVLEALLEAGHPPAELAMYRRFVGAIDDTVNIEIDVFPVREFARRTMARYGVDIPIKMYDILPEHFAWYMQDPGARWFRHKTCWPVGLNAVICHEVYPELQTDVLINVGGGATPTVENNSFYWTDADFNLNFMTPRFVHFFCDPRWPELSAAYAYGIWDCKAQDITEIRDIKRQLGFPKLENLLDRKWVFPQVDGKITSKNDWRHCKKDQVLMANGLLSEQGKLTLKSMESYLTELGQNHSWFNHGDVFQDYVASISESHLMEDIM